MSQLDVFEPAMCCPTGVCGVSVDPVLAQFNADLQALSALGVTVVRHGLSHDAAAFASQPAVVQEMQAGMDRLPICMVDGHIVTTGLYPSRLQLMVKLGLPIATEDKPRVKLGDCGCQPGQCC